MRRIIKSGQFVTSCASAHVLERLREAVHAIPLALVLSVTAQAQQEPDAQSNPCEEQEKDNCLLGEAIGRLLYEDLLKNYDDQVRIGVQDGIEQQHDLSKDVEQYRQALTEAQERLRSQRELSLAQALPDPNVPVVSPLRFLDAPELLKTGEGEVGDAAQVSHDERYRQTPELWRRQISADTPYFRCRANIIQGEIGSDSAYFEVDNSGKFRGGRRKVRARDTVRLVYARFQLANDAEQTMDTPDSTSTSTDDTAAKPPEDCLSVQSEWTVSDWQNHWFPLAGVIPGWRQALIDARPGDLYRIVVGPELAYGDQGAEGVAPGETLYYEVGILDIDR